MTKVYTGHTEVAAHSDLTHLFLTRPEYPEMPWETGVLDVSGEYGTGKRHGVRADGVNNDTDRMAALVASCVGAPNDPFGTNDGSYGSNTILQIPRGRIILSDELLLNKVTGLYCYGSGRNQSVLVQTKANAAHIRTDGCAYATFEEFGLDGGANNTGGQMELDWGGDNTNCVGLQATTVRHVHFSANGFNVAQGLSIGRSDNQGDTIHTISCRFLDFTNAGYVQWSSNALVNTLDTCNFSGCYLYSIRANKGSLNAINCGFENGLLTYQQIINGGADFIFESSGNSTSTITGTRSESYIALIIQNNHKVVMEGCHYVPVVMQTTAQNGGQWRANHTYAVGEICVGLPAGNADGCIWKCTIPGTSGGTEPVWPTLATPTRTDGTITWTRLDFNIVYGIPATLRSCELPYGRVEQHTDLTAVLPLQSSIEDCVFTRKDWMQYTTFGDANNQLFFNNNSCRTALQNYAGSVPQSYYAQSGGLLPGRNFAFNRMMNLGSQALLFSTGIGNNLHGDVGFVRGDGSVANGDLDILALIGTLGGMPAVGVDQGALSDTIISGPQGTGTGEGGCVVIRIPQSSGVSSATRNIPIDAARWFDDLRAEFYGHLNMVGKNVNFDTGMARFGFLPAAAAAINIDANSYANTAMRITHGSDGSLLTLTGVGGFFFLSTDAVFTFNVAGQSKLNIGGGAGVSQIGFTQAVVRLVGGATSSAFRNSANTNDNVLITDAGLVTLRNTLDLGAGVLKIGGTQVAGPRDTGWSAMTGTPDKTAHATYNGGTASVGYVQAELQAVMDAVKVQSQRNKALTDALLSQGQIGA